MRKQRLLALFALALGLALVVLPGPAPAGAGGWAVTSLDPLETPVPGEPVEVGFTVLQHGRSPVDATATAPGVEAPEYGFVVTAADGEVTEFAASPDGQPGHFVGEVTFPTAGTYTWAVRQGWFGLWDLGELVVEPPSGASATPAPVAQAPAPGPAGDGSTPAASLAVRLVLPTIAAAALALLAIDVVGAVRRSRRPVPASA
jgi:hypothetical protein